MVASSVQTPIDEVPALTTTLVTLGAKRAARKEYWFFLTGQDATAAAPLGDAAVLAYAVIRAAAWGPRADQWVTVSRRAADAYGRGYRWWHAATSRLQAAGLIDIERHRGRAPRYRLQLHHAGSASDLGGDELPTGAPAGDLACAAPA